MKRHTMKECVLLYFYLQLYRVVLLEMKTQFVHISILSVHIYILGI